jgi:hypothetical protein
MTAIANDTLRLDAPRINVNRRADFLVPHLTRIVRRAMRHRDDRSPMAKAVRAAASQFDPGTILNPTLAEEFQLGQVVRRLAALLTPKFSAPAKRGAHRETVCA